MPKWGYDPVDPRRRLAQSKKRGGNEKVSETLESRACFTRPLGEEPIELGTIKMYDAGTRP